MSISDLGFRWLVEIQGKMQLYYLPRPFGLGILNPVVGGFQLQTWIYYEYTYWKKTIIYSIYYSIQFIDYVVLRGHGVCFLATFSWLSL